MRPVVAGLVFPLATFLASSALGVGIYNPDFSEGLAGWTTWGQVSDGGGFALLEEHPTEALSSIEQVFRFPAGICALSFVYEMTSTPTGPPAGPWDSFAVWLLDPVTFESVVGTNPWNAEFFYYRDSNGTEYYDPDIVRTDGGYVRLDLGAVMDQIGDTDLLIAFDLLGAIDGFTTQVRIDNITLIPEPATLALLALGALGILHRRRRSR
jgi:hypothetical protein